MVKQAIKERRQYARAKRIMSIQFKLVQGRGRSTDKSWGLSTTQDMSLKGLSFYADREYCVDDILNIHVIMSGVLDVYNGQAQVVRMERKKSGACYLTAVRFVDKEITQKNIKPNRRSVSKYRTQKRV